MVVLFVELLHDFIGHQYAEVGWSWYVSVFVPVNLGLVYLLKNVFVYALCWLVPCVHVSYSVFVFQNSKSKF